MNAAATVNAAVFVASQALKADEGQRQPEIATLTREMVRGDEPAWVRFHTEYSGRLHRYLLVLLRGNEDAAAELLQVTLGRIARHVRAFDDEPVFWMWLARIARTVVIDTLRKDSTRDGVLRQLESAPVEQEPGDERWVEFLQTGLQKLDDDYRDLLTRKYLNGATVKELAAERGVSEKAIESRLVRAREKLRSSVMAMLKHEE